MTQQRIANRPAYTPRFETIRLELAGDFHDLRRRMQL
jgi:hypothetical protein